MKRAAVAVAVAGALGAAAPASALTGIQFDPTGLGGVGLILDQFVWGNNQVLALDLYGLAAGGPATTNTRSGFLYGQGTLAQEKLLGSPIAGSFTGFTYTFKIPITAASTKTGAGGCSTGITICFTIFADNTSAADFYGADNYFRIYDTVGTPNLSAGTGFATGPKIFEGNVNIGALGTTFFQSGVGGGSIGSVGGATSQAGIPITTIIGSGSLRLDVEHCSAADIADPLNLQCNAGAGGNATGATALTAYFRSDVDALTVDVDLATSFGTPFDAVPVPATVGGVTPDFGLGIGAVGPKINNMHCEGGVAPCDMIYQGSSADSYWKGTVVPEPGSVALLGLGLALLGGMARRKSSK